MNDAAQNIPTDWSGQPFRSKLLTHPNATVVEQFMSDWTLFPRLIFATGTMLALLSIFLLFIRKACRCSFRLASCIVCMPVRILQWCGLCKRTKSKKSRKGKGVSRIMRFLDEHGVEERIEMPIWYFWDGVPEHEQEKLDRARRVDKDQDSSEDEDALDQPGTRRGRGHYNLRQRRSRSSD